MTPTAPPSPAAVYAAHQARYDAAVELIRAGDSLREVVAAGRATGEEKWRHDQAERAWDAARGVERPAKDGAR